MDKQASELIEKIRQQFDTGPYPRIPLEQSPKGDASLLYIHNLVTPYYLRNKLIIDEREKVILDAGCGTGYKSLGLALANPGAKIIGIDLSEESVKLARQRLQYHGIDNVEFHVVSIESLPQLGLEFDYINCDEVLYLFPELYVGLQAMKSVLKPEGIIRANLHSALQRLNYYRAQEVFKMMGLMDENPRELEIELLRETMRALKDSVTLKSFTWNPWEQALESSEERILMNYLFQGDKGYTIPEMFSAIRAAELEFIGMVNWWQWDLMELFKEPDNLPVFLGLALPETTVEEELHIFELLHPVHRLLDFWCAHPDRAKPFVPVAEWQVSDWQSIKVHLHPQLITPAVKEELIGCIGQLIPFEISRHLPIVVRCVSLDTITAACLLPLWEEAQSMLALVERWQKLRSVHPVTLEPTSEEEAFGVVMQALTTLESLGYVLLERLS
jgi:2-polyprenyl-3-methyl-5-hydroxy-6-metoxy-1,4-benzoquinol methylase